MTAVTYSTHEPLVYNGEVIDRRDDLLSLTDMWRAAGSPEGRRPDDWKKDSSHREFIEHVALVLNAPVEGIWKGTRGRHGGGTMAHWQLALPYAKWINHDLHMWCNDVVRAHMEGRRADTEQSLTRYDASVIGNIVKNCTGVVIREQLEVVLPTLIDQMVAAKLAERSLMIRYGKTAGQITLEDSLCRGERIASNDDRFQMTFPVRVADCVIVPVIGDEVGVPVAQGKLNVITDDLEACDIGVPGENFFGNACRCWGCSGRQFADELMQYSSQ